MIHWEYSDCVLPVLLFVVGIVLVVDLLALLLGVIIYKFAKNRDERNVIKVLLTLFLIVFTIVGLFVAFILANAGCH